MPQRSEDDPADPLDELRSRLDQTLDSARPDAVARRESKGSRTARANLTDLCDDGSFVEYGRLAVAAQRSRRDLDELRRETPADGVITGIGTVNSALFGAQAARTAVIVNDYTVLAGTQGYFHHLKLDRIFDVIDRLRLPTVMFTEGGGGRPGDVDVLTSSSGLTVPSFASWAGLSGKVPRIAVNHGYCFAGNAALFGSADVTIATRGSWIGMAGPAMIEGGGLGIFSPKEIGPIEVQSSNGVVDVVAEDEAEATALAKKVLGYFQGDHAEWSAGDQTPLREALPADRRFSYKARPLIETLVDDDSFVELRRGYGSSMITALVRIGGRPMGVLANDTRVLGGAIDATAAEKAARFLQLLDVFNIPVLSLCDTPGFMVGPESEKEAAVRRMSRLFVVGAQVRAPWICVFLRKGYGLGAMAMAGGSLRRPDYTVSWPQGEFGAMGLEGAVRLGFKRELESAPDPQAREQLFNELVTRLYRQGRATEAASYLEIDAVIDPADTREVILSALGSPTRRRPSPPAGRRFVDTW